MKKHRVLWIEDEAYDSAASYLAPVSASLEFTVVVATNFYDGMRRLADVEGTSDEFDAVIVDIRYGASGYRLGMLLLRALLLKVDSEECKAARAAFEGCRIPNHVRREVFGVFTIETPKELMAEIEALKIPSERCAQKGTQKERTELLELIRRVVVGSMQRGEDDK